MTETQRRLRQERDSSVEKYLQSKEYVKNKMKAEKEKFPYTKEQYENRDVLRRFLKYFTKDTKFTVFVKNYFTDDVSISCPAKNVDKLTLTGMNWLMLYKVHFANIKDGEVMVTVIRKYKCTASKFYDNLSKHKSNDDDIDDWEGIE